MEKESEPIFEGQHIDDAVKWLKPKLEKHWEEDWGVIQDAFLSWGNRQFVPLLEEELDHAWALVVKKVVPKKKYLVDTQTDEVEITMTSWGEINKLTFPKNRWRISDLLPIEGYVVVAAISGERKSWFALEMMNALTTPRPLLHEDRFETKGCSVLYVDCEMSNSELQRRGKQLGFNEKHTHGMHFITGDNLNLSNPEREDLDVITDMVKKHDIKVVIIDTFRAVAGGMKEEKAEEVRAFFSRFRPIKDMGVCIIFLDHFRKPSHFEGKIPKKEHLFASQDKVSNSEVLLMLRTEPGSEITSVYQRKNRLGPEISPFNIRMEDTDINSTKNKTKILYDGEIDDVIPKAVQAQEIILEILKGGPKTRKELLSLVYKESKIAERTTSGACRELEKITAIEVTKKGKENLYTLKPASTGVVKDKNVGKNDSDNNSATTLPLKELKA